MSGTGSSREREFHRWLRRRLPAGREGLLPLGDDAAALVAPPGSVGVWTIDALIEGTHFPRGAPGRWVGSAAAAVSLSDLAAKGATPAGILLAIQVPPNSDPGWARSVVLGAQGMAEKYQTNIIGGDTKPSPTPTVVSSALGWANADGLAPRTAARSGEIVATTGVVGRGGAAAERYFSEPRNRRAIRDLLDVRPRVAEGRQLARYASAMLDTSDGLGEAARLLAAASGVGILLDEERIPWAPGLRQASRTRRLRWGFFGGDYELLVTIPKNRWAVAQRAVGRISGRLTSIGTVTSDGSVRLLQGGRERELPATTWDPWRSPVRGPRPRGRVSASQW